MKRPEEPRQGKESQPSRLEEARRVIEEYAADLREILKELRKRLQ